MWEKQEPQQVPEELKGLEATGPVKGQSYPGGDRQWEEQEREGMDRAPEATLNATHNIPLCWRRPQQWGLGNSSNERTLG